jgi:arsenite methyltransferase
VRVGILSNEQNSEEYAEVASHPEKGFHFHTGRPLARMLEYADEWLSSIPESSIESFAGTGNPFSLAVLHAGERVG